MPKEIHNPDKVYTVKGLKVKSDVLVNKVLSDFHDSVMSRSKWEERKRANHDQYYGILPIKNFPWPGSSNLNVPITAIVTDTYHANLAHSFFSRSEVVSVDPVSADDIETARKRGEFINYQLKHEIDESGRGLRPTGDKIFGISLKYSDCITKQRYVRRTKVTERKVEEITPEGTITETIEDEKVLFDGVIIDVPNIDDIYKAPNSIGVQRNTCEYIIHRTRVSQAEYEDLIRAQGYKPINFGTTENEFPKNSNGYWIDELGKLLVGIRHEFADTKNYATLFEWHGEFYNDDTGKVEEIVAIIHPTSRVLCKAFINEDGFRPFVQHSPFPVENQAYGQGMPEKLKYLQAELNTIHNQRRDSEAKRIAQPGFYNQGSSFDPTKYLMEPNAMHPVDDVANIFFPKFQDAPSSLFSEEELVFRLVEQLTAASQPIQGVIQRGEQTATEFAGVIQRSNIRFDLVFKRYEDSFREMVQQLVALDQKFMPEEKEFRIVGSDGKFKWVTIKRQEMQGKLDLTISTNSISAEIANIQKAQAVLQNAKTSPLTTATTLYEAERNYYSVLGVKNVDRLLQKPPEADTRTPVEEHDLMYGGRAVDVDLRENHQAHLLSHIGESSKREFKEFVDPLVQKLFLEHEEQTRAAISAKSMMANVNAQVAQAGQVQGGQDGQPEQAQPKQANQNPGAGIKE